MSDVHARLPSQRSSARRPGTVLSVDDLHVVVPVRGRRRALGSRYRLRPRRRRGARHRRRVRLRQVGHVAGDHGPAAAEREGHRLDQVARRGAPRPQRREPVEDPRQRARDGVPGSAVGAHADLHGRLPARRGAPVHQDLLEVGGRGSGRSSCSSWSGIPNPKLRVKAFPHEFSGGMRQRVMIAMAIANDPDVIIADEPTTALDVTIQAQVLDVLKVAQKETGAAVIMITHDLGVVAGIADRVQVMYAGRSVETGTVDDVYYRPRMPYTIGLLGSVPRLDESEKRALVPVEGNPPSPAEPPAGLPVRAALPDGDRRLPTSTSRRSSPSTGRRTVPRASAATRSPSSRSATRTSTPLPDSATPRRRALPREQRDRGAPDRRSRQAVPADEGRGLQAADRHGARGRRRRPRHPPGRDARPRRRVRLRQDHDVAAGPRPRRRRRPAQIVVLGKDTERAADARRAQGDPARPAGRVPGSDGVARSAAAGVRHPRRAARALTGSPKDPIARRVDELLKLVGLEPATPTATRSTSPVASASASASPGRWPSSRS